MKASLCRTDSAIEERGGLLEVRSDYALTESERMLLDVRKRQLAGALAGGDVDAIERRVAKLFNMMAVPGEDGETVAALVGDYARLLSSQPLWAVDAACVLVLRSGATFRPSAPDLLRHAVRAADPFRVEAAQIARTLRAVSYDPATPEQRARVAEMFADLAASLSPDRPRGMTAEQHGLQADRLAREYAAKPIVASEALLASRAGGKASVEPSRP